MGSLLILRPGHERLPDLVPLPDGRFRLIVYLKFPAPGYVPPAYGTIYDDPLAGDEATRYANLRLILTDPGTVRGKPSVPALLLTYEQIHATEETRVGKNTAVLLEDGRGAIEADFIQFSAAPATPGTIGTSVPPDSAAGVMQNENAVDEGVLRRIKRRYITSGILATTTEFSNNGALEVRSITYYNGTPDTPSGFTLVGTSVQNPGGLPGRTYRFAKGTGEISRSTRGDGDGTITSIRYLTVPDAVNPVPTLSGFVLLEATPTEADGYRVWAIEFGKGNDVPGYDENGRRRNVVTTYFAGGVTPTAITVGQSAHPTVAALALDEYKDSPNDSYTKRVATYIEATSTVTQVGSNEITRDPNGRKRIKATFIQRRNNADGSATTYTAPAPAASYGSTGCVFAEETEGGPVAFRAITRIYLEATGTWVAVGPDKSDRELNGALRVRQLLVAVAGTAPPGLGIGSTTYSVADITLYLGTLSDAESDNAVSRIEVAYLQPGVLSKRRLPGPVKGTIEHMWKTWMLDPTNANAMTAANEGDVMPGSDALIDEDTDNVHGFKVRVYRTVAGTITGTKQTYKDVVDVRIPGTVDLTTQAVTAGALTGTIAIAVVTPPRTKSVAATVTVEITNIPPVVATPAYDLGAISCSVTSTQAAFNYRGFDQGQTLNGGITMTYPRRSANIGASVQNFPGCYLLASTATGSFTYNAGAQYALSTGGSVLTETVLTSTETHTLTGTGATSSAGYATTGVLLRKSREVFSTLGGVTYYEVITWTV